MPNSDALHRGLVDLMNATSVRPALVARLFDPDIGMPDDGRIRAFIPDLHMLSYAGQERFPGYGFDSDPGRRERRELMVRFLSSLGSFARGLPNVKQMEVYQTGDCVDLWREDPLRNDPGAILGNNGVVWDLLYNNLKGSPADPEVPVYFMRGNHDFSILDWGEYGDWQAKYFFDDSPLGVLHGDVFDWIEKIPEWLKRAIVYLTGVQSGETNFSQEELQRGNDMLHRRNEESGRYRWASKYRLGGQSLTLPGGPTGPVADNVIDVQDPAQEEGDENSLQGHRLMGQAYQLAGELARTRQRTIRLLVIGHTHHARIVRYKRAGELFVLMDCGAWLEEWWVGPQGQPPPGGTRPCHQVGLVIGNDCRIYQLDLA
jgi:UDP-2,3-diacylglucosamine pyrophosphatase LpxH